VYGAELEIVVTYDGDLLHKSKFRIRPFPAMYYGFLVDGTGAPLVGVEVSLREVGKTSTTNADGYFSFGFGDFIDSIPGGKYHLDLNPGLKAARYGGVQRWVNIPSQMLTRGGMLTLPTLASTEPYRQLVSGAAEAILQQGDLRLFLTDTTLVFPNGAPDGHVHAQYVDVTGLLHPSASTQALPFFGYAINPPGVEVNGDMGVRLAVPQQGDTHDWVSGIPRYVVLLGLDRDALELVPVGVGEVDVATKSIRSIGQTRFTLLDFIGVSFVLNVDQTLFASYAAGTTTLDQVVAAVMQGGTQ
jgi:hypothetical protein